MTLARFASALAVLTALGAGSASATPATPDPLERLVFEARSIVVGRPRTRPEHVGDVYDLDVDEVLKGTPPAPPLRIRSPGYFVGCIVHEDDPPAPALERDAKRVLVYVTGESGGALDVGEIVKLDSGEAMTAWFSDGHDANLGPAAIAALVRLDDKKTDARAAAGLWTEGLAGTNPLLVESLLDRFRLCIDENEGPMYLGPDLLKRAQRDLAAAATGILDAVLARCGSDVVPVRTRALTCAWFASRKAQPQDRPRFDAALAAARATSRADDRWLREASLRLLVALDDDSALDAIVGALKRRDPDGFSIGASVNLAVMFAKRDAARRAKMLEAAAGLLEAEEHTSSVAQTTLAKITGLSLDGAGAWRAWWKNYSARK